MDNDDDVRVDDGVQVDDGVRVDDDDDDRVQFNDDKNDGVQFNDDEYRFVLLAQVGNELRIVPLHLFCLTLFSS